MKKIEIEFYINETGKSPYTKWILSLSTHARATIHKRIARVETGNFGDLKTIKGIKGLYELRIHEGPGYRVYLGKKKHILIILLCGGKKGSQSQDISKAKKYWQDYTENNKE